MPPLPDPAGLITFFNGQLIPCSAAALPLDDLGVTSGVMLTERLRTVRHLPCLVAKHLDRLDRGMRDCGWALPAAYGPLAAAIHDVVKHNTATLDPASDVAISVLVTGGPSGLHPPVPTVCISTGHLPVGRWRDWWQRGVPLVTTSTQALPAEVIPSHLKHRSRLHWWLADREAQQEDPRSQALLRDAQGFVTETSSGNLFVRKGDKLWTPRAETTLPGVAQGEIIRLARELGFGTQRGNLSLDDIQQADEAFLTSSTYCLLPVASLDGQSIGQKLPGEVTEMLTTRWSQELGLDFRQQALQSNS